VILDAVPAEMRVTEQWDLSGLRALYVNCMNVVRQTARSVHFRVRLAASAPFPRPLIAAPE
jgi:hypothetical protein